MEIASANTSAKIDRLATDLHKLLALVHLADGHLDTIGDVYGITKGGVSVRLKAKAAAPHWQKFKRQQAVVRFRAARRRAWWKMRLRSMGIDPFSLTVDEPLYWFVHLRPRGSYVRAVVDSMRAEGLTTSTPEGVDEVIRRALALRQSEIAAQKATASDAPDDESDGVDDESDGVDDESDGVDPHE